ncbi:MAG: hypothetical protein K2N51_00695 [Lachnospiraceae bacterium]|nr:hypothetical protein [Lachnospiraceae bacterium]
MFLRFFVYAVNDNDAMEIIDDCLNSIKTCIFKKSEFILKPYWKIPDMYVVEVSLKLKIEKVKFVNFLESISDHWLQFGSSVTDELLASETDGICKYMKNKISMVNIFFENDELYLVADCLW